MTTEQLHTILEQNAKLLEQNQQLIAMLQNGNAPAVSENRRKISSNEKKVAQVMKWYYELSRSIPPEMAAILKSNLQKKKLWQD